jgi:hypothetical protein
MARLLGWGAEVVVLLDLPLDPRPFALAAALAHANSTVRIAAGKPLPS